MLATVVFFGYALTPGLGSLVANTDSYFLGVHFNKFTSPGMILVGFNLLTIIGMLTVYDESVGVHDGPIESPTTASMNNTLSDPTTMPERIVNIGAAVFIFLNFNARGILSVFETVNIPLFIEATGSDPESVSAVVDASNFQFYLGLLGLLSYFSIEYFRHSLRDVTWVQLGFVMLLAGNVLLVVAPTALSFPQLAIAEFLVWSVGCPITTAVVLAAFSKLLGGRPQGTLMGLLGSAASVSRIVLPLLPAAIPSLTPVFWINIVLCALSIALLWWSSTRCCHWQQRQPATNLLDATTRVEGFEQPALSLTAAEPGARESSQHALCRTSVFKPKLWVGVVSASISRTDQLTEPKHMSRP
ncbi:unnamed protein product [Phytophthora lilii]|uniref:Unnamed protein product n=1 Tax=Phytophthora lilii TaxID=2077276 RepID=A0A9W7CXG5_9STRA|nr:unnamed protein product [Phytophthora lilii]